jgi:hypothetical protein
MVVETDPLWGCTDDEVETSTDDIEVFVPVAPIIGGTSADGLTIRVCYKVDPACEAPLDEVVLDGAGVDLSLPSAFNGYIEIDDPDYYPILYFFPARMRAGARLPGLSLLPVGAVGALGAAAGAELDPTRGHILLNAVSCDGENAEGVQFASKLADELAIQFYVDGGLAVAGLTATTAAGNGGYVNFPLGGASITVSKQGIEGSEGELGSVSLLVRAGFISMAWFAPAGY